MPTEESQAQDHAFARIEQGAERFERKMQGASDAIRQLLSLRERVGNDLKEQRGVLAGRMRRLGSSLQQTSDQMTREDKLAQELLDGASERLRRAASYIDNVRGEELANDLRDFARRQPSMFFGGAFLVGIALGRLAKSRTGEGQESPRTLHLESKQRDSEDES